MSETELPGHLRHRLTIFDLFTVQSGEVCGAETNVRLLDQGRELGTVVFRGKVGPGGDGYHRSVYGPIGMSAEIITGPGRIELQQITEGSNHG